MQDPPPRDFIWQDDIFMRTSHECFAYDPASVTIPDAPESFTNGETLFAIGGDVNNVYARRLELYLKTSDQDNQGQGQDQGQPQLVPNNKLSLLCDYIDSHPAIHSLELGGVEFARKFKHKHSLPPRSLGPVLEAVSRHPGIRFFSSEMHEVRAVDAVRLIGSADCRLEALFLCVIDPATDRGIEFDGEYLPNRTAPSERAPGSEAVITALASAIEHHRTLSTLYLYVTHAGGDTGICSDWRPVLAAIARNRTLHSATIATGTMSDPPGKMLGNDPQAALATVEQVLSSRPDLLYLGLPKIGSDSGRSVAMHQPKLQEDAEVMREAMDGDVRKLYERYPAQMTPDGSLVPRNTRGDPQRLIMEYYPNGNGAQGLSGNEYISSICW